MRQHRCRGAWAPQADDAYAGFRRSARGDLVYPPFKSGSSGAGSKSSTAK
jgi:hypothetical protein